MGLKNYPNVHVECFRKSQHLGHVWKLWWTILEWSWEIILIQSRFDSISQTITPTGANGSWILGSNPLVLNIGFGTHKPWSNLVNGVEVKYKRLTSVGALTWQPLSVEAFWNYIAMEFSWRRRTRNFQSIRHDWALVPSGLMLTLPDAFPKFQSSRMKRGSTYFSLHERFWFGFVERWSNWATIFSW